MANRTNRWLWLITALVLVLLVSSPAQAKHRDDGDVIHCKDLASCINMISQPGEDGDLSGADASDIGSVGDDPGPDVSPVDLPPVDATSTFPTPAPPDQVPAGPSAPTPPTTTEAKPTDPPPATTSTATQTSTTGTPPNTPAKTDSTPSTTTAPQVVTTVAPKAPPAATTTTVEAPAPAPPPCLNHPDWAEARLGWQRSKDGNCYEIPKLDLVMNGASSVPAPNGKASFTMTIVNKGPVASYGDAFRIHLDGTLSVANLAASQGDPCGLVDSSTFVCAIGTIPPNQSVTVSIGLNATGNGTATAYAEPGGEADTDVTNDHLTITVNKTVLQTMRTVQQHGLQWGGHYYRDTQVFARVLAREGSTWRGWKMHHPALAAGLVAHANAARQSKK
jgi:hypothetical protein